MYMYMYRIIDLGEVLNFDASLQVSRLLFMGLGIMPASCLSLI